MFRIHAFNQRNDSNQIFTVWRFNQFLGIEISLIKRDQAVHQTIALLLDLILDGRKGNRIRIMSFRLCQQALCLRVVIQAFFWPKDGTNTFTIKGNNFATQTDRDYFLLFLIQLIQPPDSFDHQGLVATLDQLDLVIKCLLGLKREKWLVAHSSTDDAHKQGCQQDSLAVRFPGAHPIRELIDVTDTIFARHRQGFHQGFLLTSVQTLDWFRFNPKFFDLR